MDPSLTKTPGSVRSSTTARSEAALRRRGVRTEIAPASAVTAPGAAGDVRRQAGESQHHAPASGYLPMLDPLGRAVLNSLADEEAHDRQAKRYAMLRMRAYGRSGEQTAGAAASEPEASGGQPADGE